jgi:hypothetical protein
MARSACFFVFAAARVGESGRFPHVARREDTRAILNGSMIRIDVAVDALIGLASSAGCL